MSDYTVIKDIGETLKKLLKNDSFFSDIDIILKSPKEIKVDEGSTSGLSTSKVSIFLYQILENPYLKNEEPERIGDTLLKPSPLSLDLLYLVTPYSTDETDEKRILGKVMQIFFDNAILTGSVLEGSLKGTDEEIKLLFNPISLDDLTKLWNAFQEVTYRLSVSYLVTPVRIDSTREMGIQRVVSKEMGYYYAMKKEEKK